VNKTGKSIIRLAKQFFGKKCIDNVNIVLRFSNAYIKKKSVDVFVGKFL